MDKIETVLTIAIIISLGIIAYFVLAMIKGGETGYINIEGIATTFLKA